MSKKAIILHVFGRVQGVGYRYYAQKKADETGISGFVRNRPDGSVYIEAEGSQEALEAFTHWCEEGPAWARVSRVEKQEIPFQGYQQFEIR
ncbi:Acylphosphate phosphohydrolase, putative [hydrothermal vent metagenome]|uniref:Acylphosphate phosphohydrolase, putative n=1 Tax=hydrothermal vent metagenome TaxID=652676 RepID=A0A3B0UAW4_9ZZZZ